MPPPFSLTHPLRRPCPPLALATSAQLVQLITKPHLITAVKAEILNRRFDFWRVHDLARISHVYHGYPEIAQFVSDRVQSLPPSALCDARISDLLTLFPNAAGRSPLIAALTRRHHLLTAEELDLIRGSSQR